MIIHQETLWYLASCTHHLLQMNIHTPLALRISNSIFLNYVLQLIFSIFRNTSYTSPLNSSTEGTLLKCLLETEQNACNSNDVDALKFQLVHHNTL